MGDEEKRLNFEEALKQLEKIVSRLEEGNLQLDEALEEFNKGIELVKECNQSLEKAKEKINVVLLENDRELLWENWKE